MSIVSNALSFFLRRLSKCTLSSNINTLEKHACCFKHLQVSHPSGIYTVLIITLGTYDLPDVYVLTIGAAALMLARI